MEQELTKYDKEKQKYDIKRLLLPKGTLDKIKEIATENDKNPTQLINLIIADYIRRHYRVDLTN